MTIGLIANNDGTGALQLGGSNAISLDTSFNATMAGYVNAPNTFGFKNRIINGAMLVNQRNTTTTVNSTANTYGVDQWAGYGQNTDGVFTMVQSTSTPPTGFRNFLRSTVTTGDTSIGATQSYGLRCAIEGFNVSDLGWGAAGASTVTLSFWVRSSLTGTFSGSLLNNGNTRSYVFSFVINAANTWEQKTVTIAGDTTGTWTTDNTAGIKIFFSFGAGSTFVGAAGSWTSTQYYGVTGGVNLIATLSSTFDITGVQLEKGSTATSFDFRSQGTELQLCQRYFELMPGPMYSAYANVAAANTRGTAIAYRATKRGTPTITYVGTSEYIPNGGTGVAFSPTTTGITTDSVSPAGPNVGIGVFNLVYTGTGAGIQVSAEL